LFLAHSSDYRNQRPLELEENNIVAFRGIDPNGS